MTAEPKDYTPRLLDVRVAYVYAGDYPKDTYSERKEAFDRFIRKVKAETLREALAQGPKKYYPLDLHGHMGAAIPVEWLEDEAARIEGGTDD